jgi:hypothetical protein
MADIKKKLKDNTKLVHEQLDHIKYMIDQYSLIGEPDFSHVGDLTHVAAGLQEIVAFLEGTER